MTATTEMELKLKPIRELEYKVFIDLWLERNCVAGSADKMYILKQSGTKRTRYTLEKLIDNKYMTLSSYRAHGLKAATMMAERVIALGLAPGDYAIWRRVSRAGYGFEQAVPCRVLSVSPSRVRLQPVLKGGADNLARKASNVSYKRVRKMKPAELQSWGLTDKPW